MSEILLNADHKNNLEPEGIMYKIDETIVKYLW